MQSTCPTSEPSQRPEFFRLPRKGGDPYFGLTRSWYLAAEKQGQIHLVRLRRKGLQRGVVMIPYAGVIKLIEQAESSLQDASQSLS